MQKTIFNITKMDCPSEEQLIRMKLQKFDEIKSLGLTFKTETDSSSYWESQPILSALETLNLDTTLISTEENTAEIEADTSSMQRKLLWTVLIINFLFFGLEMLFGIFSNSMGLVVDSLICLLTVSFTHWHYLQLQERLQEKITSPSLQDIFKSF